MSKITLASASRRRKARYQLVRSATDNMFGKRIGAAAIVTHVVAAVNRFAQPAESFLPHGYEKIARIFSATKSRPSCRCSIKTALGGESRLHRREIQCANNEVLARVPLWAPRQQIVFF